MVPVPEFIYVPLRVAREQLGDGPCALKPGVVSNTPRIAPIAARRGAVLLAFVMLISFVILGSSLGSTCLYSGKGRGKGSPVRGFFLW
jgi:hypothetical protein